MPNGQWVTVTEIMVEDHSRPGVAVPLQLTLAGCLGCALEDIPNFSVHEGKC